MAKAKSFEYSLSRELRITNQFSKDFKTYANNQRVLKEFDKVANELIYYGTVLTQRYKPHALKGEWDGFYECHLLPDVLLIWEKQTERDKNRIVEVITLVRIGTHSELFD